MTDLFTMWLDINRNGGSAPAVAGARERARRYRELKALPMSATRPGLGRSTSEAEVRARRAHLAELAEPSAEFVRLKAKVAARQAIGDNVAANDNQPWFAGSGVSFSRAA